MNIESEGEGIESEGEGDHCSDICLEECQFGGRRQRQGAAGRVGGDGDSEIAGPIIRLAHGRRSASPSVGAGQRLRPLPAARIITTMTVRRADDAEEGTKDVGEGIKRTVYLSNKKNQIPN